MVLAVMLTIALQSSGNPVFSSYVNDSRWDAVVRAADVDKSPRWRNSDDSPPLAPRAAVRSARRLLGTLFTHGEQWDLSRVSLQVIAGTEDSWLYLVDFGERPPLPSGIGSFVGETMTIVVLMDGSAVVPTSHRLR
jgi:hypothetical protein